MQIAAIAAIFGFLFVGAYPGVSPIIFYLKSSLLI